MKEEECLRALCTSKSWFTDGILATALKLFAQVSFEFTYSKIHIFVHIFCYAHSIIQCRSVASKA